MARKTTVTLEDDLEGGPAVETVRFSLGGTEYEIDLNATNAAKLRQQLASFAEHARRSGSRQRGRSARTGSSREPAAAIRAWAREHGITVSDRGRIPAGLIEQYEADTGAR